MNTQNIEKIKTILNFIKELESLESKFQEALESGRVSSSEFEFEINPQRTGYRNSICG